MKNFFKRHATPQKKFADMTDAELVAEEDRLVDLPAPFWHRYDWLALLGGLAGVIAGGATLIAGGGPLLLAGGAAALVGAGAFTRHTLRHHDMQVRKLFEAKDEIHRRMQLRAQAEPGQTPPAVAGLAVQEDFKCALAAKNGAPDAGAAGKPLRPAGGPACP